MLLIFDLIKDYFLRPQDTCIKKMNKFLLWLNFVHSDCQNWNAVCSQWSNISTSSCINYLDDVMEAILKAFSSTPEILDVPLTAEIRRKMHEILVLKESKFANALVSIDGKASQMFGRSHKHLRCFKFKFRAAQNHMHIYDRVLGLSLACSIGNSGSTHDITVFKRHPWSQSEMLQKNLQQYLMLADSGYVGSNAKHVAVRPKRNQHLYHKHSKEFWTEHSKTRSHVELEFGKFWQNQFPTLNYFKKNSKFAFRKKRLHISCSLIVMNMIRLYRFYKLQDDTIDHQ